MARGRKGAYRAEKRRKELKRLAKREAKRKKQMTKGNNAVENEETEWTSPGEVTAEED